MVKHQKHKDEQIMFRAAKMFYMSSTIPPKRMDNLMASELNGISEEHLQYLLSKKYFASWRLSTQANKRARDLFDSSTENPLQNGTSPGSILAETNMSVHLDHSALIDIDPKNPQYIPISSFYISFIITPLCSNASELVSSIAFAMKKEKENLVMTYTQLYSAAIMNNTMCLGVFCALVYFRDLEWYFSAEVTSILFTEFLMGALALKCRKIYKLYWAIPVILIFFLSLLLVMFLENVLNWG